MTYLQEAIITTIVALVLWNAIRNAKLQKQNKQTEEKQNNSNLVNETVILPKPLLNEFEKLLKEKDISKDELFLDAISEYLEKHKIKMEK